MPAANVPWRLVHKEVSLQRRDTEPVPSSLKLSLFLNYTVKCEPRNLRSTIHIANVGSADIAWHRWKCSFHHRRFIITSHWDDRCRPRRPLYPRNKMIVRHTRLFTVADRTFSVAARTWNSLPQHVTSAPSLKLGIHYPCSRAVFMVGPWTRVSFFDTRFHGPGGHVHGPWTRASFWTTVSTGHGL